MGCHERRFCERGFHEEGSVKGRCHEGDAMKGVPWRGFCEGAPPPGSVNKRAVRILLECILVCECKHSKTKNSSTIEFLSGECKHSKTKRFFHYWISFSVPWTLYSAELKWPRRLEGKLCCTLIPGFESYHCLFFCVLLHGSKRLGCHAGCQEFGRIHTRGGVDQRNPSHTGEAAYKRRIHTLKSRAGVTRTPKQWYQRPHRKDWCPPKKNQKNFVLTQRTQLLYLILSPNRCICDGNFL